MITNYLTLPLDEIAELCARYSVHELSMFGSAARGSLRADSDIDLLVEFNPDAQVGFITLIKMQRELSELLARPVDLVPKNGLHPRIRKDVLATAQVLYAA